MGSAKSYTVDKIVEIANQSLVSATINPSDGHLIFTNGAGETTDIGGVSGSSTFPTWEFQSSSVDQFVHLGTNHHTGDSTGYQIIVFGPTGFTYVDCEPTVVFDAVTFDDTMKLYPVHGHTRTTIPTPSNTRFDHYIVIPKRSVGSYKVVLLQSKRGFVPDMETVTTDPPLNTGGTPMIMTNPVMPNRVAGISSMGLIQLASDEQVNGLDTKPLAITLQSLRIMDSYRYYDTLYLTASGVYSQNEYMNGILNKVVRAYRIRCVGGGGGGGGAVAPGANNHGAGGGGGGGGYAEAFVKATDMPLQVSYTVGYGGGGGPGTAGQAGVSGGPTNFGTLVKATGGSAGFAAAASPLFVGANPGVGGVGEIGQFLLSGSPGLMGTGYGVLGQGGNGGDSQLGSGAVGIYNGGAATSLIGLGGNLYGGGGSGAMSNANSVARAGGRGAPGIIILERYK